MRGEKRYYVYIMASLSRRIYTGSPTTSFRRVLQHKSGKIEGFTQHYRIQRLVHYETFHYVTNASDREKQIKGWDRARRVALIERDNPAWDDLAADWGTPLQPIQPKVVRTESSSLPR
jgi:putative endonuclease